MKKFLISAAAAALAFAASAAQAVTEHTSSFISSPIASNDFETLDEDPQLLGTGGFPANTVYSHGGIDVEHVGTGEIWTTFAYVDTLGWYATLGYGYTRITLTDGGTFNEIEFLAGHGAIGDYLDLNYELRLGGAFVATGHIENVFGEFGSVGLAPYGLSGETFDEVRLQVRYFNPTFDPAGQNLLAIDNIKIGISAQAVPEPASWAMMIGGFALAGTAMRRRGVAVRFA